MCVSVAADYPLRVHFLAVVVATMSFLTGDQSFHHSICRHGCHSRLRRIQLVAETTHGAIDFADESIETNADCRTGAEVICFPAFQRFPLCWCEFLSYDWSHSA